LGVVIWLAEFSLLTSHVGDALIRKAQGLTVWVVEEGPPRHERAAAAEVIEHCHVKGRGRGAFFLGATHMQVVMMRPAIGQPLQNFTCL
jgi:hypothetical protein